MAREPEPAVDPPDGYYDVEDDRSFCIDCDVNQCEEGYDRCEECNEEWFQEQAEQEVQLSREAKECLKEDNWEKTGG